MTHSAPRPARAATRARRLAPSGSMVLAALAMVAAPSLASAKGPASAVLLANNPPVQIRVAAGGGHVVAMRETPQGSDLVELRAGAAPRAIGAFPGGVGWPTVGTSAAGRAVAVVSPCIEASAPCALVAIDLATGHRTAVPGSVGAYIGDMDHGRTVVARRSVTAGVRIALGPARAGGRSTRLPLGQIGYPAKATQFVDSLDLRGGAVAATILAGDANGGEGGASSLILARAGAPWRQLARSSYGGASGILRVFRGATITRTGVRALYDGGDNDGSYVGRWTSPGKPAASIGVKASILTSAAFNGDTLIDSAAVEVRCGSEEGFGDCPVTSTGPLRLG